MKRKQCKYSNDGIRICKYMYCYKLNFGNFIILFTLRQWLLMYFFSINSAN